MDWKHIMLGALLTGNALLDGVALVLGAFCAPICFWIPASAPLHLLPVSYTHLTLPTILLV